MRTGILKILALTLAFAATIGVARTAAADDGLIGSHQGVTADDQKVELLAQPIAGRTGSYLGLLVMIDPKAVVYLIDPLDTNSYAMIPVQVTSDGEIGVTDDNPSLVLNLLPTGTANRPAFSIVDANSGNRAGFKGPIRFDGTNKPELTWLDLRSGSYDADRPESGKADISAMTSENQATVSLTLKSISGNYIIRKKLGTATTGLFTLRAISVRNTGAELETYPRKIGVFLKRRSFWGDKEIFLLINPQRDEDIIILKKN